jgi:hypothetical protein
MLGNGDDSRNPLADDHPAKKFSCQLFSFFEVLLVSYRQTIVQCRKKL